MLAKACEGTLEEVEESVGSLSKAQKCCLLGLTLKAGMLSNSQKRQKEKGEKEREEGREGRREGGWKEKEWEQRGYVPHSEKLFWF